MRVHVALLLCLACQPAAAEQCRPAEAWPAAELLFRQDARWLGTDGAVSAVLDENTLYWSFDDSFIDPSGSGRRERATMVRNSIAIQKGRDPLEAGMAFHWGQDDSGAPRAFFKHRGEGWYWTGAALRLQQGPLVQFLWRQKATPGEGLGFTNAGYDVAVIDNPDAPVADWNVVIHPGTALPFDAVPATALVQEGDHVFAFALRQQGAHAAALVRYEAGALARGQTSGGLWWAGPSRTWLPASALGAEGPAWVIDDAGAENSVHFEPRAGAYLHLATYGFGAAHIGVRSAPALAGPWGEPVTVYKPPELDTARPFVYAAMAHPGLRAPAPAGLVASYATNAFEFGNLFTEQGQRDLYWPRLVLLDPDCDR